MLPDVTLLASLLAVLENLRWMFTAPSFATFLSVMQATARRLADPTPGGRKSAAGAYRARPGRSARSDR